MLIWLKRALFFIILALLAVTALAYALLNLSLPSLDGRGEVGSINAPVTLKRDAQGQVIIDARSMKDAAYALGFAHSQDRYFQMDLLRRNAAGELSELFGKAAIEFDKKMRFHQLRKRSERIFAGLPQQQQALLYAYTDGVNNALSAQTVSSFEYLITQTEPTNWRPEDSLLVIYSMYLDLQSGTFKRDMVLEQVEQLFGQDMRAFLTQPNQYQAALDDSKFAIEPLTIPKLPPDLPEPVAHAIVAPAEVGSNNWAVSGEHTPTGQAMVSDDMHLGLAVPVIWYRAQLNVADSQITGVTLPGTPAVVVGSNNALAWGFTNAYIDTSDWVRLSDDAERSVQQESITVKGQADEVYELELSDFGPVKTVNGQAYALSWVGHYDYALNLDMVDLMFARSVPEAFAIASEAGMPVQNLVAADDQGQIGWQLMGAVAARTNPSDVAIADTEFQQAWFANEPQRPALMNPKNGRIFSANARVLSTSEAQKFGNGGYSLGARQQQIRDRLFEKSTFSEQDFLALQLDNEARFMRQWQVLLLETLSDSDGQAYIKDVENWQACACADSVGYTLVRTFRNEVINLLFAPIEAALKEHDLSLGPLKRHLHTATWQLLESESGTWGHNKPQLLATAWQNTLEHLQSKYGESAQQWQWGKVNALALKHPFAKQVPQLSSWLNMHTSAGYGDSFMPAVQRPEFGASQRFIAQPGHLDKAIMMVPGGQSAHPLSPFYRMGFDDYAEHTPTPLIPGPAVHRIDFRPKP